MMAKGIHIYDDWISYICVIMDSSCHVACTVVRFFLQCLHVQCFTFPNLLRYANFPAVTPLAEVLHSTRKNIVNVHTSYYESFFLLSVDVWVDGFPLQLEGHDQSSLGLSSPIDDVAIPVKVSIHLFFAHLCSH